MTPGYPQMDNGLAIFSPQARARNPTPPFRAATARDQWHPRPEPGPTSRIESKVGASRRALRRLVPRKPDSQMSMTGAARREAREVTERL